MIPNEKKYPIYRFELEGTVMLKPKEISDADLVFPTDVDHLLPKWEDIPKEFEQPHNRWVKVFSDWFYGGLKNAVWNPKPGIDPNKALRHIQACMGSWNPKHEHKEAGVAYLMSLWFEDVTYEKEEKWSANL